jgi:hypothetical protein
MDATLPIDAEPRLLRSVCIQLAALAVLLVAADLPWRRNARVTDPKPPPPAPKHEQQIRVIEIPKPPPPPAKPEPKPAQAQAPSPAHPPAPAHPQAPAQARAPAPTQAPHRIIPADSTAVHGVRLRVLVPRTPTDLASHLHNSGGCLVVSRLAAEGAEVISVFNLDSGRAIEQSGPPCNGVPRLLRDGALNDLLGDPVGRARASLAPDERNADLALQVLLTPRLHVAARSALQSRFGALSEEEMGRQAAETGYELTCFAETSGNVRCQ